MADQHDSDKSKVSFRFDAEFVQRLRRMVNWVNLCDPEMRLSQNTLARKCLEHELDKLEAKYGKPVVRRART